jgi:K+/H+ antiporter YhaU regulatory subunit KhtT
MSKKMKTQAPAYAQIALDIAARIARGELQENTKVSGRSKMSSEYGVSPETIRRAMILLEQTGIVHIAEKSGVIIKSKEKALLYLQQYSFDAGVDLLKDELKDALARKAAIDHEIISIVNQIIDISDRFNNIDPLKKFEFIIPQESWLIGKTLKESQFYQHTKATVIAFKRNKQLYTSPGPDVEFFENDVVVIVGSPEVVDAVKRFIDVEPKAKHIENRNI